MRSDLKERWTKALRSGEYEQGKGRLRKRDKFCCLGVLCDLYVRETPRAKWVDDTLDESYCLLPQSVIEWSEIEDCSIGSPYIKGGERQGTLAGLNDNGDSFERIADLIEEHL